MPGSLKNEEEFRENHEEIGDTLFSIPTIVVPLDKEKDVLDESAVLVNNSDTYIGSHIGKYLSEQRKGATTRTLVDQSETEEEEEEVDGEEKEEDEEEIKSRKNWKVLGTLSDKNKAVPLYLWAVMRKDNFDAYMKELLKCGVIIYDVTQDQSSQRFDEIRTICDTLKSKWQTFRKKRIFILISSLHSWSNTKGGGLSESNYRFRRTHPKYRDLQLLERYVIASGKMTEGMVKAYVIGAGVVYGGEESTLNHWFKSAWLNSHHLNIYGDGKNRVPMIYVKDLAKIVQNVMESAPKSMRYIIAVDPVVPQQCQIVKAISNALGTGRIEKCPNEHIYLNRELTTFQADEILLNLDIGSTFCQENFEIEWTSEEGFPSIVNKLVDEYRKDRNLASMKIVILGPPGSGKSTMARQISDMYHLHHFTLKEILESTLELLQEVAAREPDAEFTEVDTSVEKAAKETARSLLEEIDDVEWENVEGIPLKLMIKIIHYRLLTHPCQNQGFILDGFPETYEQAELLFYSDDDVDADEEEEEEDGDIARRIRLVPDHVFILEAPVEFLKNRMASIPIGKLEERHLENNYQGLLDIYNELNKDYESSAIAYFDDQELAYSPIDIVGDESQFLRQSVSFVRTILGKPRNFGISKEEEEALLNTQKLEVTEREQKELEDYALLESFELEERKKNIQKWMEKLAKVKKEEVEQEEASLLPLRNYLMSHVIPTLTRGLIDVTRARPEDPIDYLAEFLFQNNPCGMSGPNMNNNGMKK